MVLGGISKSPPFFDVYDRFIVVEMMVHSLPAKVPEYAEYRGHHENYFLEFKKYFFHIIMAQHEIEVFP